MQLYNYALEAPSNFTSPFFNLHIPLYFQLSSKSRRSFKQCGLFPPWDVKIFNGGLLKMTHKKTPRDTCPLIKVKQEQVHCDMTFQEKFLHFQALFSLLLKYELCLFPQTVEKIGQIYLFNEYIVVYVYLQPFCLLQN